jgi:NTE family protein
VDENGLEDLVMLAFVLSGAANYGAMQAGALEVILASGMKPDMLVGSSAGALNAIYLSADPSLERAKQLQQMWRAAGPDQVGVPKPFIALRRLVQQKDGLIDSRRLAAFLEKRLPTEAETFGELEKMKGIKTYAVAVDIDSGVMRVFGDEPDDRLLDGAMASSAVPPYFPPWVVGQQRFLDGGVYAKLPLCVAIERGATQVIAIDVTYPMGSADKAHGLMGVSGYSLSLMIEAQTAYEIAWARLTGVPIRILNLEAPSEVPFWDYTQADFLIELGRNLATAGIGEKPLRKGPALGLGLRKLWHRSRRHPLASRAHHEHGFNVDTTSTLTHD